MIHLTHWLTIPFRFAVILPFFLIQVIALFLGVLFKYLGEAFEAIGDATDNIRCESSWLLMSSQNQRGITQILKEDDRERRLFYLRKMLGQEPV